MITKFNDYLNESKMVKEPIDFRGNEQDYKKRIFDVIDDILPKEDRYITIYEKIRSEIREINGEIIVKPIINVNDNGYNVYFTFDIYEGSRQLISFSVYDIKNNDKNHIWTNTNIYEYYLETKDINKIIKLIKSLSNFTTNISDRSVNNLIDSIYDKLSKK